MRLFYFYLILCLLPFNVFSQDQNARGGLQLKSGKGNVKNIKALIVGVSTYANYPEHAQLKYADDDAIAFAEFLKQHASVSEENIVLLTNEDAVFPNVFKKLIDQLKASQEDDILIIYFAGHGDVNYAGDAYLITNDAFAPDEEGHSLGMGGAIPINMLQGYIAKATSERGFKVMMVTDACRSGHLTKTDNNAATITALIKDWNNTYKYVSCGPNQLSQEGTQWGGGHGAFTYYMLKGLMGEADRNGDKKIFYGELNSYVNQKVSDDTGYKQYPQFKGEATDVVVNVDEKLLDLARQNDFNLLEGTVASRGSENEMKEQLVKSFYDALKSNRIISPKYFKLKESVGLKFFKTIQLGNVSGVFVSDTKIVAVKNGRSIEIFDINDQSKKEFQIKRYPKLIDYNDDTFIYVDKESQLSIYQGTKLIKEEKYHKAEVKALVLADNGLVYSGDEKGNVYRYRINGEGEKIYKTKGATHGIAVSDIGDYIALKNEKGDVDIIDSDNNLIANAKLNASPDQEMYFMDNSSQLLGINYSLVKSFNVKTGKLKRDYRLPNSEKPLKLTRLNDSYILVLSDKANLYFINILKGFINHVETHPMGKNFKWDSNQEVVASVSTTSIVTADVDVPLPFASEWYQKILKSTTISQSEKNDVKNSLAVALQTKAQRIITPFILGQNITPSALEVKEAIYELNYATRLYKDTPELVEMINLRRWFLQAYLIIIENNVKDFPLAISYFEKILKVTPDAAYPHNGIAIINQKLMKLEETKESVEIAEKLKPYWTEPKNTMVNTFLAEENYQEALKKNEEIIKIIPNGLKGYYGKAQIYINMGYYQNAWDLVKKMEEIDSNDPGVWETKMAVLTDLGLLVEAQNMIEKRDLNVQMTEKAYVVASNLWIKIYDHQTQTKRQIKKAESSLLEGIKKYPSSAELKAQLAKLYTEYNFEFKVSSKEVNSLLDEALLLDPFNATALRYKAQYAIQIENNPSQAKTYTINYTKKRGQFSDLDIFLANVAYAQKDLKTLETCAKAALLKNPYKLENYKLLWNTYVELGEEEELHKLYLMGKDMLPYSPWFSYKYALYFRGKKDNRKSASYVETALSISPDYNYAYVMKNPEVGIKKLYNYSSVTPKGAFYKVEANSSIGIIDYAGRAVVPLDYHEIEFLKDGYAILTTSTGMKQISSPDGQLLGNKKYDSIEKLECGLMKVRKGDKFGCLDHKTGKIVVPIKYAKITNGRWSGKPTACCRYTQSDSDQNADFYDGNGRCVSCN